MSRSRFVRLLEVHDHLYSPCQVAGHPADARRCSLKVPFRKPCQCLRKVDRPNAASQRVVVGRQLALDPRPPLEPPCQRAPPRKRDDQPPEDVPQRVPAIEVPQLVCQRAAHAGPERSRRPVGENDRPPDQPARGRLAQPRGHEHRERSSHADAPGQPECQRAPGRRGGAPGAPPVGKAQQPQRQQERAGPGDAEDAGRQCPPPVHGETAPSGLTDGRDRWRRPCRHAGGATGEVARDVFRDVPD